MDGRSHRRSREQGLSRRELMRRAGGVGISLGLLGPLLAACGGSSSSDDASSTLATGADAASTTTQGGKAGGTLTFARNQDVQTLNPMLAFENGSIWVIPQIFEPLVDVRYGQKQPQPAIAESWTTSPDGLEWTFVLRQGPTFSNGDPVTAEDVKFSIERFANPDINVNYYGEGKSIAGVEVVDDTTVLVTLKQVDGAILDNLAMFVPMIIPKAIVEEFGDEKFGEEPVGSGPFMLESWDHGVAVNLTRNPHYWREGRPYLDKLVFAYVPDDNTRVLQLESGDCNVASAIPHSQVDRLKSTDGLSVLIEPYYAWNTLLLRNTEKPLDDKSVRQALAYATPREAILKTVLFGYAELATSQIGPNEFNNPDVTGYAYDIDKASSLLASSSAPDGFDLTIGIASGDSVSKQTAQVIQQEWANLGVNVTVEEADIGTAIDNWYSGKAQSLLTPAEMLSSDTLSNDELSFIFFSPEACCDSFFTGYSNPDAIKILEEANGSLDATVRQEKFYELQQLTMEDTATITMFNTLARTGIRSEVQNFHTVPTGWWNLDEVSLSQ